MSLFITSREHFLNRFEPRGDGFVYSRVVGSRGVVVTASERDQLIRDFDRTILPAGFVVFLGLLAGISLVVALSLASVPEPWRSLGFLIGYFGVPVLYGFSTDPMRTTMLRDRPEVDSSLTKPELRKRWLDDTSWSTIALWLFIASTQLMSAWKRHDDSSVGRVIWVALAVAGVVVWTWFGVRKLHRSWSSRSSAKI